MIEAVVFDLDGTLVLLPINYEMLFEEFKRIMRIKEVHPVVEVVSKTDRRTRELVFKVWDRAELSAMDKTIIKDEGQKVYKEHLNKPKALVTLQGRNIVELIAKQLGFSFDVIVTREDTLFRTEQLQKAIIQLGVKSSNVLFVGNTEGDALAADRVGCHFLCVG